MNEVLIDAALVAATLAGLANTIKIGFQLFQLGVYKPITLFSGTIGQWHGSVSDNETAEVAPAPVAN